MFKLKQRWVLHGVVDDDFRAAFAAFSKVTQAARELWRVHGVNLKGSTTRTVDAETQERDEGGLPVRPKSLASWPS